jgi:hypothetical protein
MSESLAVNVFENLRKKDESWPNGDELAGKLDDC